MRLNEIITEQQLDERPMGVLGKLASKAKSFVPGRTGRKAKGELKVGDMANKLSDEFDEYLGQVDQGQGATAELVIGFLKKKGYPTKGAEAAMKEPTMSQKVGQAAGSAVQGVKKAAGAAADAVKNTVAGAKAGMDKAGQPTADQQQPKATANNPTDNNIAIKGQKKIVPPSEKKVVNQSVEYADDAVMEGFSGLQLDKIFMAAAKDMVMQNTGGIAQPGTGKVDEPAQGGPSGFMSGFKQGLKGGDAAAQDGEGVAIPKEIEDQLSKLDQNQKKELLRML